MGADKKQIGRMQEMARDDFDTRISEYDSGIQERLDQMRRDRLSRLEKDDLFRDKRDKQIADLISRIDKIEGRGRILERFPEDRQSELNPWTTTWRPDPNTQTWFSPTPLPNPRSQAGKGDARKVRTADWQDKDNNGIDDRDPGGLDYSKWMEQLRSQHQEAPRYEGRRDGQRIRPVPNRPWNPSDYHDNTVLGQEDPNQWTTTWRPEGIPSDIIGRGVVPEYGPDPETLNAVKQSYGEWPTVHPSMGYRHKRTPPSYQVLGPPPGSQMGRPQFGGFNQPMRQPQYGMGGMGMMPMGGMGPMGGFAPSYNMFNQQYRGGMPGGGIGSVQPQQFNTFGRMGMGGFR